MPTCRMSLPSTELHAPGWYVTRIASAGPQTPAASRSHRTPFSISITGFSWARCTSGSGTPSWPNMTVDRAGVVSRPISSSSETPRWLAIAYSVDTDGWVLPISTWEMRLAETPSAWATERRLSPRSRRAARSLAPRLSGMGLLPTVRSESRTPPSDSTVPSL